MEIVEVYSEVAPKPVGPYSQAIVFGDLVFVSGQIGIDPTSGKLVVPFEEQVEQALKNAIAILREAGSDVHKVIKATLYLTDMQQFSVVNELYKKYIAVRAPYPARETVEVSALPLGAAFEISLIAHK